MKKSVRFTLAATMFMSIFFISCEQSYDRHVERREENMERMERPADRSAGATATNSQTSTTPANRP